MIATAAFFGFYRCGSTGQVMKEDNSRIKPVPAIDPADGNLPPGVQRVSVQRCASYAPDEVFGALRGALHDIRFTVRHGMRVLLKPNVMAQNTPEQAASTHPAVVDAACRLFRDNGCEVSIGDSSAFYQGGSTRLGFETTGIAAVARKYGARLIPFEATTLERITTQQYLNPLYVTGEVFSHDLVVSMPKLKIHRLARYTGAIKNMYGCVAGGTKQVYHRLYQDRSDYREFWGKPLVDVYQAVNPGLSIMDAVVGLDRDGPAALGKPRMTGLLLASESGPALDMVMCRIIDFDPQWVPAVREAAARCLTSPERAVALATFPLVTIPYLRLPDPAPRTGILRWFDQFFFDRLIVMPRFTRGPCNKCGDCASKCAAGAISFAASGHPIIDYGKCIYCYCCSEYCTQGAITLEGGFFNHLIRAVRVLRGI